MKINRFNLKAWISIWSAVGTIGVIGAASSGVVVLAEFLEPGSILGHQNTKVIPKPPKPSLSNNELIRDYYTSIKSEYQVKNEEIKSLLPSEINLLDTGSSEKKLTINDINKKWLELTNEQNQSIQLTPHSETTSSNAQNDVMEENSKDETNNSELQNSEDDGTDSDLKNEDSQPDEPKPIPELSSISNKLNEEHDVSLTKISHDNSKGTVTLRVVVSEKNGARQSYLSDGNFGDLRTAGKTIKLTGFATETQLIKKQYDLWTNTPSLVLKNNLNNIGTWNTHIALDELAQEKDQGDVISKINQWLPDEANKKFEPLLPGLKKLNYKVKISNVEAEHQTSYQLNQVKFNLSILNEKNTIYDSNGEATNEQEWRGLTRGIEGFPKKYRVQIDEQIEKRIEYKLHDTSAGWKRVVISLPYLTTKEQVKRYLRAIVKENKTEEFLKIIEKAWSNSKISEATLKTSVFIVSFNPLHDNNQPDNDGGNKYKEDGSTLLGGGRGPTIKNNKKVDDPNNGMGNNWKIDGKNGLLKEIKNLLSLSTFKSTSDDANNPFLM